MNSSSPLPTPRNHTQIWGGRGSPASFMSVTVKWIFNVCFLFFNFNLYFEVHFGSKNIVEKLFHSFLSLFLENLIFK